MLQTAVSARPPRRAARAVVRRDRIPRYRKVKTPIVSSARREPWPLPAVLVLAVLASATLHGLVWLGWGTPSPGRHQRIAARRIQVAVIEKEPAKPQPEPEASFPRGKTADRSLDAPPPAPKQSPDAPPPPNTPQPAPETPPVLIAGISLSSTSSQGSFAVGVGNTLYAKPAKTAVDPSEVQPYKAKEYAPPHLLSEPPEFLDNVSEEQMRQLYPEEARKADIEGEVRVRLTIDDDGTVARVRVIEAAGHGFDEAAKALARLYRFKPARINGRPVATEVPFTIRFELR